MRTTKVWTNEEIIFLKENYGKMKTSDLSIMFGRSIGSIRQKHYELVNGKNRDKYGDYRKKKKESAVVKPISEEECRKIVLKDVESKIAEERKLTKVKTLADYEPRELMLELKRRGYVGYLTYTETIIHKISLEKL